MNGRTRARQAKRLVLVAALTGLVLMAATPAATAGPDLVGCEVPKGGLPKCDATPALAKIEAVFDPTDCDRWGLHHPWCNDEIGPFE